MKIIYFVDFHISVQLFFLFCIAEKRVCIVIKKMIYLKKKNEKMCRTFVKIMIRFCFNRFFKG